MPDTFTYIKKQFAATLGNHVVTSRWSYTVPAGRRAYVSVVTMQFLENNVIPISQAQSVVRVNGVDLLDLYSLNAVAMRFVSTGGIDLTSADVIDYLTVNGSAINAVFWGSAFIREY